MMLIMLLHDTLQLMRCRMQAEGDELVSQYAKLTKLQVVDEVKCVYRFVALYITVASCCPLILLANERL